MFSKFFIRESPPNPLVEVAAGFTMPKMFMPVPLSFLFDLYLSSSKSDCIFGGLPGGLAKGCLKKEMPVSFESESC